MSGRNAGAAAATLSGAVLATVFALAAPGAAAHADTTSPEPAPFLSEFPAFTGTPTTVFEIPGVLQDVQGDMELTPFGSPLSGTANEFTSVLGIQAFGWSQADSVEFNDADAFEITFPGAMGSSSNALFEEAFAFSSIGNFTEAIAFPVADFAVELDLSTVGGVVDFDTPFGDFDVPLFMNF